MISVLNKLFLTNTALHFARETFVVRHINSWSVLKQRMDINEDACTDIVWMDLEMTGLDVVKDKILEISCLITDANLNIKAEGPCFAFNHPEGIFQQMNAWCMENHFKSGLVEKCMKSQITNEKGEQMILDFLKAHIPKGKCPLAGNSIYMDRLFLRQHMPSVDEYLHYRVIDVSTVKELAARWYPNLLNLAPKKKLAHRSLDDIIDSIKELQFYKQHFFKEHTRL